MQSSSFGICRLDFFLFRIFGLCFIVHMFAVPTGVIPTCDSKAVMFELQQLKASQNSILQQLLSLSREISAVRGTLLPHGGHDGDVGHAPGVQCVPQVAPVAVQCVSWSCPVCGITLGSKESFKGHIRKLVYPSKRPGCHLNPLIPQHRLYAHRFDGATFHDQGYEFCKKFYHEVCVCCTKRDPDDVALRHLWLWLDSAQSDADFPEYDMRCQMLSRKRSCSAARDGSTAPSSSQSSFASSSSGGSSSLQDQSNSPNF